MADELHTQIKISADAAGVETGVTRAKRSLSSLGQSAEQVGEQAARGLGKLGGGGEAVTKSMDRVTKSVASNLQRQIAALEAGGTATRQYQESIARLRGADMAALKPMLDAFDAAKNRAEAAARAQGSLIDRLGAVGPVASIAAGQLAALAGSFTLGAVFTFVKNVNDGVDALNDLRDATGAAIESISALEDVGQRSGASLDLVGSVLIKFNDLLSKARPDSDINRQLKAIGLSAEELRKLDPAEALRVTAVALAGFADDANKARFIQDQFGKSVKEAAPFLANLAERGELVAKVTAKQAEEAEKFNKELFALQTTASDVARSLSTSLVPVLNRVFEDVRTFGSQMSLAGLASELRDADREVRRLQERKGGLFNFAGNLDAELEKATARLATAKAAFKAADTPSQAAAGLERPSIVAPQSSAEIAASQAAAQAAAKDAVEARLAEIRRGLAIEVSLTKSALDEIGSMRRLQGLSEREGIELAAQAEIGQLERQRAALQAELTIQSVQKNALKEVSTLKGQIDLVDTEISERRKKQLREINELTFRQRDATLSVMAAQRQQAQDELAAYEREKLDLLNESIRATNAYVRGIDDANALLSLEVSLLGQGSRIRGQVVQQYQAQLRLQKEIERIQKAGLGDEEAARQKAQAQAAYARELAGVQQRALLDEWDRTMQEVEDSLTDALMRGFQSGEGFAENFKKTLEAAFQTMILKPIIQATLQQATGGIGGVLSSVIGGGSAGGNGVLGMANNASSLVSLYNNAGSYASKIGSLFGLGGGASEAALLANEAANAAYWSSAYGMGAGTTAGAVNGGAAAAGAWSASSVIPIVGWILAAIGASSTMYGKGYSINGVETGTDMLLTGGVTKVNNKVLGAFMSDKWADILSGGPLLDKSLDLLGISTGEKRFGGHYGVNYEGDQVFDYRRGGYIDGKKGEVSFIVGPSGGEFGQDEVKKTIGTTVEGINGILGALESSLKVTAFQGGLETSTKGRGGVFSGGYLTGGISFGETGVGGSRPWESTSSTSPNAQEAFDNYALDLQQATIQALQKATDIPKSIQEYLKQFDAEEMTTEQIKEALTAIGQRASVIGEFRDALKALPFENLRALSFDTAEALIAAAGGLDALDANLSGYFGNYFSDEERRAASINSTSKAFTELGLVMPNLEQSSDAARAAFRAMVGSIDVTTEKGREQYVGLLALQGAFADLTPIIDNTAEAARQAQSALQQRQQLEMQLLQLQGDTGEIRRRQLAELLNDENRAIQKAFFDLQDKQAAEAAAKAAQEAADRVKAAWQSVGDTLVDEVKRIRGEIVDSSLGGFAYTQGQFALATAQARAGDQAAATSLPELSRAVIDMARQNVASAAELKAFQAQIAASLLETTRAIAAGQGITVPAFAEGGAHSGGLALVGERGPELAYLPPAQIYTANQTTGLLGGTGRLERLIEQLVDDSRRQAGDIARLSLRVVRATEKGAGLLEAWDAEGAPPIRPT